MTKQRTPQEIAEEIASRIAKPGEIWNPDDLINAIIKAIEAERARVLVPSDEEIDGAEYPEHVIEQALIWACGNPSSAEKFLRGYSFALEQSQHTVCEDVLRDAIDSWDKYILSRKVVGKELDWDMFENAEKALKALRAAVGGE